VAVVERKSLGVSGNLLCNTADNAAYISRKCIGADIIIMRRHVTSDGIQLDTKEVRMATHYKQHILIKRRKSNEFVYLEHEILGRIYEPYFPPND
jgi:hypothetical protein